MLNDSNLDFLCRDSILQALAVTIGRQNGRGCVVVPGCMDPSRCELSKGLPIPALGHRECWALELQRLGRSKDVQGSHSL